jgi:uncharacterized peroxidase-related enzyme
VNTLPLIDPATADGEVADLFDSVKAGLGSVINMTKAMAHSPALLRGYLSFSGALNGGVLPPATREMLALAVAQANSCGYCLSAHAYLAEHVAHLDAETVSAARKADNADPKTAAILDLAATIIDTRGELADGELDEARAAGVTDQEIAEVIGHVGINVLTNYFNKVTGVVIDFPVIEP